MSNVIKKSEVISELFNTGNYISTKTFSVIWINNNTSQVAFIAGKKLGKAHIRNYCKRRLREIYRQNKELFKHKKVLLIARNGLLGSNEDQIEEGLQKIESIFNNKTNS